MKEDHFFFESWNCVHNQDVKVCACAECSTVKVHTWRVTALCILFTKNKQVCICVWYLLIDLFRVQFTGTVVPMVPPVPVAVTTGVTSTPPSFPVPVSSCPSRIIR